MGESQFVRPRRALLSVSDKRGLVELGRALASAGAELVATGNTAKVLIEAGLKVVPIEQISGSPEAFQGRMKTLSFPVCSGLLYRRGDAQDEADLAKLKIEAIDVAVVNFYPFEETLKKGAQGKELIEQIDIGGPTLVRAAAKNAPDVLCLVDPNQYGEVIEELKAHGGFSAGLAHRAASRAWTRVADYDQAIDAELGDRPAMKLRYGENPHQSGKLLIEADAPIAWPQTPQDALTPTELSYNNILDASAGYQLASDLIEIAGGAPGVGVVIVKHNNPCGVAWVPSTSPQAQRMALELAWAGDPVSSFGGVVIFTSELSLDAAAWLSERFVELVAAPGLNRTSLAMEKLLGKRKNLKAVRINRFGAAPRSLSVRVPGGTLMQAADIGLKEEFRSVTRSEWKSEWNTVALASIACARALKSNALALGREVPGQKGSFQLIGAGQGQPNRIDALERLLIPRAAVVLEIAGGSFGECVMASDAFFPFKDVIEACAHAGIKRVVQPGGSMRDKESIEAADLGGVSMALTGVRHFKH